MRTGMFLYRGKIAVYDTDRWVVLLRLAGRW